jgi:hypothetical protein
MGATPNPSPAGPLAVRLSLPTAAQARLELLDVAGRRVGTMDFEGVGERVVRFEVDRSTHAGLYWLRLTQEGRSASTCVVMVP